MKFELTKDSNLILINNYGYCFLVDTGSPISFSLDDKAYKLNLDCKEYELKPNDMVAPDFNDALAHIIPNYKVNGVIGLDLIKSTNLSINYLNKNIDFNLVDCPYSIEMHELPIYERLGYVRTKLEFNGKVLDCILDSGATIGYVKFSYLKDLTPIGEVNDYNPTLKEIHTKRYSIHNDIQKDNIEVGVLAPEIEFFGDAILSLYDLVKPGFCQFDFKNKKLKFTRRFI